MLIEYISRMDLRLYQWMCTILQISRDCVKLFDPARYLLQILPYLLKIKKMCFYIYQTYILQIIYYKYIVWQILQHFCCTNKFNTRSKFLKRDVLGSTSTYIHVWKENMNIEYTMNFRLSDILWDLSTEIHHSIS